MLNYQIENNMNFYDALFQSLDDDSDEDMDNECQITGLPLADNYVTMECQHKFNYSALYTEICRQKYVFKTYDVGSLSKMDRMRLRENNYDYYIRCPYCRHIQFTLLPYYEGLGCEKKYGINSLDPALPSKLFALPVEKSIYDSPDFTFMLYGVVFKKGHECSMEQCQSKFVTCIPNTALSYCKYHYKKGLKMYKDEEKQKVANQKKQEKEKILSERQKLFDEKNAARAAKGLPPLKHLPPLKVSNVVIDGLTIVPFVPELDTITCTAILKTGVKKGQPCGCKLVDASGRCKRHLEKAVPKTDV